MTSPVLEVIDHLLLTLNPTPYCVTALCHSFLPPVLFLLPLEGFPPVLPFDIVEIASLLVTGVEHVSTIGFCLSGCCKKKPFSSQYHALQYLIILHSGS